MASAITLDSLPDAIVVFNALGLIVQLNNHAEALFGYSQGELAGQPIALLMPHGYRDEVHPGSGDHGLLTACNKSGREVPVEIMFSPDAEGTVIAVVRDVSERRALEQRRDDQLGCLSHEMKTPLTVIGLEAYRLARRLAAKGLGEEQAAVEAIAERTLYIRRLVDEMQTLAQLEAGPPDVMPSGRVDLVPFVTAVLKRSLSAADHARVRLSVLASPVVMVGPTAIERVLVNLVQNALKYSPPDSPIVVRVESQDGAVLVSVIDQGPGLTDEEASYVFDKFRRAPTARKGDGLGLGLYISRQLIESLGGQIGVSNAPGVGSCFYFTVPVAEQRPPAALVTVRPVVAVVRAERLRGKRVLVVDDDWKVVSALLGILRDRGLNAVGASSDERALAMMGTYAPDIAVVALDMPGSSGLSLLRRLRECRPDLPAVIMSRPGSGPGDLVDVLEENAAFVAKPIDVGELLPVLGRLLETRRPAPRTLSC